MNKLIKTRVSLVAAGLIALGAANIAPSFADYAPSSTDVVGVGGDTPQFDLDFLADGDASGDVGYNAANNANKLVSIDATADSNGRTAYLLGATSANAASSRQNPTVVYRAGTSPIQRVSSSGGGISALLADTGAVRKIDFIRSGSLPTAANQSTAASNGWGFLHVVELGTDTVSIAAANSTNAPAGLSINDLLQIYTGAVTTWNQLPGNSTGSTATIVPELPPTTSAITKQFIADLTTANGGVAPTLSAAVQTVEQNDPSTVNANANAIVPFSAARLNLYNSGYFQNPNTAFPGTGTPIAAGIKLLTGPVDGSTSTGYAAQIFHYIIFRNSDLGSTTPFQPGSTKNWIQTLFSAGGAAGTPYAASAAGQTLLAASGITPSYHDLGNVSHG